MLSGQKINSLDFFGNLSIWKFKYENWNGHRGYFILTITIVLIIFLLTCVNQCIAGSQTHSHDNDGANRR